MSDRRADEIARLLHTSFHGAPVRGISKPDLTRMWALELQWFSPEDSMGIADRLHEFGWLVENGGYLMPSPHIELLPPDMGWQPFSGSFVTIPAFVLPSTNDAPEPTHSESRSSQSKEQEPPTEQPCHPPDSAEENIQALIAYVARKSGLEQREVVRRAQRKRRALGPVTLWMAIALLAREQRLDMHGVLEIIES